MIGVRKVVAIVVHQKVTQGDEGMGQGEVECSA